MADIKLDISPMYEGERIRKDDLWVELGGPKADGFELSLAAPMDEIQDGKVTVSRPGSQGCQGRLHHSLRHDIQGRRRED